MAAENSDRNIYTRIFQKLQKVIPALSDIEERGKSVIPNFMALNLDVIHKRSSRIIIALSHYYKHSSGDLIPDPDMEIAVYPGQELAEALTYQDSDCYRRVYADNNTTEDIKAKKELNTFLEQWLSNLIEQGHHIKIEPEADDGE
ncbi:MAG TPA: hypothetical protein DE312_04925 [Gallionella sp.]|nr:MAG: hypothetical protein A2Z87_07920 [Gallionellales bacterium GWA2_54_124]OGT18642.1 MAG: hypothetical protein A2522_00360 [Gallionellales bacterium RIFOXYD12_FULL_53_10]HCI52648.1 hypothetical protein [Gallionella sp.]